MTRLVKVILCVLLMLCASVSACATDFPAPAYEWELENVSPDIRAIQAAVAPYWAEGLEQETDDYRNGSNRCDSVYWADHGSGRFNWIDQIYGVENCPQVEAVRPVAEAVLDRLGLDYIREPVLAKTAQRFETDQWLGAQGVIDDEGRLIWLNDQLSKAPMPQENIPLLVYYAELRDKAVAEKYTSPDDVILRYMVALDGLPLAEETASKQYDGVCQFIFVIVTPEGKVIKVDLQNAQFAVKNQTEINAPITLEEAERIALEQYPYWNSVYSYKAESAAFLESLRALSAYESFGYQPRLERGKAVYMRVGADKAVPAWSLAFRYDYVLDGEAVPVEEYPQYLYLYVSAVDGKLLIP